MVDGDLMRLSQVVSNLLTNAAKYSEPGSVIAVTAAVEEGRVALRVRDSGVGLSPEMLTRVFELFVQEPQSLARSRGGLGLGLTIVKSLVELHGGTVEARSEGRARGAEFIVRLPLHAATAATEANGGRGSERAPSAIPAAGRAILVVDDNQDAADLLADVLTMRGHRVAVAYDGPSAITTARELAPELALLDIGLPVMDGYELARNLRSLPGLERLRLVAVTGYGQDSDRQRARDAGFDEHLKKPLDLDELARAIDRLAPARGA
jgi:CheY-like chemotaxis protein/anti-sigma regulatory factor (Ser/Thr protein kinase)